MHIESGERRVRQPPRAGGRRRVAARTQCTGCSLGCGTMCTQWRPRRGGARGTAGRSGGGGCGAAGAGTSAAMRAHRSKPPLAPRPRGEGKRWQSTCVCVGPCGVGGEHIGGGQRQRGEAGDVRQWNYCGSKKHTPDHGGREAPRPRSRGQKERWGCKCCARLTDETVSQR